MQISNVKVWFSFTTGYKPRTDLWMLPFTQPNFWLCFNLFLFLFSQERSPFGSQLRKCKVQNYPESPPQPPGQLAPSLAALQVCAHQARFLSRSLGSVGSSSCHPVARPRAAPARVPQRFWARFPLPELLAEFRWPMTFPRRSNYESFTLNTWAPLQHTCEVNCG